MIRVCINLEMFTCKQGYTQDLYNRQLLFQLQLIVFMFEKGTMMVTEESVKTGICYMCTSSCPSIIHVSNGVATKIQRGNIIGGMLPSI